MRRLQRFSVIFVALLAALFLAASIVPSVRESSGPHQNPVALLERLVESMMGDVVTAGKTPMEEDGRIPVYEILRRNGLDDEDIAGLCTSLVLGGPSPEQVATNDYSAFPFVRAHGQLNDFQRLRPILWWPGPKRRELERLVAFNDATVRRVSFAEFRMLMAR